MSDDESSSASDFHDPFAFTAHKFRHKKKSFAEDETTEEEEEEEESQPECLLVPKKANALIDISIDDDEEEENSNKIKSHQNFLPAEVVCLLDNDDDDDDLPPKRQTAMNKATLPIDASWNNTIKSSNNRPLMPSISVPQPNITAEILATMQRARHARDVLLQAQRNQINIDQQLQFSPASPDQEREMNEQAMMLLRDQQLRIHQQYCNASNQQQPIHSMPTTRKGNIITLYLRSSSSLKNNKTVAVTAYTLEPLQTPLIDNYWQCHYHGSISEVSFKFDGETLKMTRTPQSYDMEDGDLIDVVRFSHEITDYNPAQAAASQVVPAANPATSKTISRNATSGAVYDPTSSLNIILRTRIVHFKKDKTSTAPIIRQWQLRRTDCLDKLIQAYREERSISSSVINLLMEERKIDSGGMTPLVLGLCDYYLLDMHVYDGEDNADDEDVVVQQPQETNAKNMVQLILRINGNDSTKEEYSIHKRDKFEQLQESFCLRMRQKNNFFNSVKLTLDGALLSLSDTCYDEDLEGGEIIDVICQ